MTENKRFTYRKPFNGFCDVYDNGKLLSCMRLDYVDKTVNLLNELAEENEQLKKDCTVLIYHNQEYRKENEQLKKDCSNLIDDNTEYVAEINQMHKENEQLKKENKKLNCIIKQLEAKYEDKGFSLAYDMGECE